MDVTASNVIDAALAMIDGRRWGPRKFQTVLLVRLETLGHPASSPAGTKLPARHVARWLGCDAVYARRVLRELVDERVLERLDGAGTRAHAYSIAHPTRWRVPWSAPWELVAARLELLSRPPGTHKARLVPRPSAAQTQLVPRSTTPLRDPCAAFQRGTSDPLVPRSSAAQASADDAMHSSLLGRPVGPSVTDGRTAIARQVIAAVVGRADGPVSGPFAARLEAAVAGLDDARPVLEAIARAQPGLRLPGLVLLVEQAAYAAQGAAPAATSAPPPPEWEPEEVQVLPDAAERALDVLEHLRNRGASCDNGLVNAGAEGGDQ